MDIFYDAILKENLNKIKKRLPITWGSIEIFSFFLGLAVDPSIELEGKKLVEIIDSR